MLVPQLEEFHFHPRRVSSIVVIQEAVVKWSVGQQNTEIIDDCDDDDDEDQGKDNRSS